jgi:menaquinone-dependent protoporphyrinogen oxidase
MKVLVTAASRYGATREIAEAIGAALRAQGLEADVLEPEAVADVEDYDAVVIGSALYLGHWLTPALNLLSRSAAGLGRRPVWLFSSGPVGDPSRDLVKKMDVDPAELPWIQEITDAEEHRLFAGKLDKRNLSRPQRTAMAVVRGLEGDFRDWGEIERWASGIADRIKSSAAVEQVA